MEREPISGSLLVYIPIIDYRAYIHICNSHTIKQPNAYGIVWVFFCAGNNIVNYMYYICIYIVVFPVFREGVAGIGRADGNL